VIYLKLFLSFFHIGLFSIGGGYAAIPFIQHQVVEVHGWFSYDDFSNLIAIAGTAPGSVAVNSAAFAGNQVSGIWGAITATVGCVLPSCIIVLLFAFLYYRYRQLTIIENILTGLRPAVVALIACAALSILTLALRDYSNTSFGVQNINFAAIVIFIIGLTALRTHKVHPAFVIIGSGIIGMILVPIG
jgi:chromate transporter